MAAARIGVVMIVLEGLRPDMVTAGVAPNLCRLSERATVFQNARSVFPSVTPVAAASIATGALPVDHGIAGNELYLEEIARDRVLDLGDHRVLRGLDQALSSRLVAAPTFADAMAASDAKVAIVEAGAGAAHLLNPRAAENAHWTFSTRGRDATPTPQAWDDVVARLGHPPEQELPRFEEIRYAADVMIELVIGEIAPAVGVLWLSEPGATSRYREIGSIEAENALRHADRQIGRVLDAIEQRQGLAETLVIVLSDHGQITSAGEIDVRAQLELAQFPVGDRARINGARLVLTGSGYGALKATASAEAELTGKAARWLMQQPWIGHVFARGGNAVEGGVPGSLALQLAGHGGPRAPDVMFTFASDESLDRHGLHGTGLGRPGVTGPDLQTAAHASRAGISGGLNPCEMSIVLMAAGPGFPAGLRSAACAGLVDVAPTVLATLGLAAPAGIPGRDLSSAEPAASPTIRIEAGSGSFRQSVCVTDAHGRRLEMDGRRAQR